MPNNLKWTISVTHLDSYEHKKHTYERVIEMYDDFDTASERLIDLCVDNNYDLGFSANDYRDSINDSKDDLSEGSINWWYGISLRNICDNMGNGEYYIGPGAYLLKGSLLQ